MSKKGQISIFLIFGIIIVLAFALVFYLRGQSADSLSGLAVGEDINSIRIYLTQCLYDVGLEGVYELGQRGGYYLTPPKYVMLGEQELASYYYHGSNTVPELSTLEYQLEKYIDDHIEGCVDLSLYTEQGYVISSGAVDSELTIFEDKIDLRMAYPIKVKRDKEHYNFEDYEATVKVRYGHIIGVANQIVEKIIESPDYHDLTFFLTFDVLPSVVPQSKDIDVYVIKDEKSERFANKEYTLIFGAEFLP